MRLDKFENGGFQRGRSRLTEILWELVSFFLVASVWPGSGWRVALLRAFGAQIGQGVVIKPYVKVKFPWRLEVGDHAWIGERAWIDNLAFVRLGAHSCVSQGAYLCTGSHDWSKESFDLITRPITVEQSGWVGAMSKVAPGVTLGEGAVLAMGSVATQDIPPWDVWSGVPASHRRKRPYAHEQEGPAPQSGPHTEGMS
jgi:putative colanic acid biosynthesis acetyltransferase WcaF